MKYLTILLFIAANFSLSAQDLSVSGTSWQLDFDATIDAMLTDSQATFEALDETAKAQMAHDLGTFKLTFASSGEYILEIRDEAHTGTWSQANAVISISMYGEGYTMTVSQQTENQLILQLHEESKTDELIHYWHLQAL